MGGANQWKTQNNEMGVIEERKRERKRERERERERERKKKRKKERDRERKNFRVKEKWGRIESSIPL